MATWKGATLGFLLPLLGTPGQTAAWAQAQEGPASTSLDRLRAGAATGKVKEIDIDGSRLKIAEAPPLAAGAERPALRTEAAPVTPDRRTDPVVRPPALSRRLTAEIGQRVRDVESCRAGSQAGQIQLNWRIQPDGRTSNTLVLEQQPTDMDVMKCARKRMESWRFTTTTGAPVDVEYAYSFARPAVPAGGRTAAAMASAKTVPPEGNTREARTAAASPVDGAGNEGKTRANAGRSSATKLNEARLEEGK